MKSRSLRSPSSRDASSRCGPARSAWRAVPRAAGHTAHEATFNPDQNKGLTAAHMTQPLKCTQHISSMLYFNVSVCNTLSNELSNACAERRPSRRMVAPRPHAWHPMLRQRRCRPCPIDGWAAGKRPISLQQSSTPPSTLANPDVSQSPRPLPRILRRPHAARLPSPKEHERRRKEQLRGRSLTLHIALDGLGGSLGAAVTMDAEPAAAAGPASTGAGCSLSLL